MLSPAVCTERAFEHLEAPKVVNDGVIPQAASAVDGGLDGQDSPISISSSRSNASFHSLQRSPSLDHMDAEHFAENGARGERARGLAHFLFGAVHPPSTDGCFVSGTHVLADPDLLIYQYLGGDPRKTRNSWIASSHRTVAKQGISEQSASALVQEEIEIKPPIVHLCGTEWHHGDEKYLNGEYKKGVLMFYQFTVDMSRQAARNEVLSDQAGRYRNPRPKTGLTNLLFVKLETYAATGSTMDSMKHMGRYVNKGEQKPGPQRSEKITQNECLHEEDFIAEGYKGAYDQGRTEVVEYNEFARTGNEVFLPSTITQQFIDWTDPQLGPENEGANVRVSVRSTGSGALPFPGQPAPASGSNRGQQAPASGSNRGARSTSLSL